VTQPARAEPVPVLDAPAEAPPSTSAVGVWGLQHVAEWLPGPRQTLLLVLVAAAFTRLLWLGAPDNALIFDELYYVNAARTILAWPVPPDAPYADAPAGVDPNHEHPPLGKVLMAESMQVFGDTPIGWRLPSLVSGLASILLVCAIAGAAGAEPWLGVLAAGLFAADNLVLVHSRIATLDMQLAAWLLLAAWLGLRRWLPAAGVACGLAALTKAGGIYGLAALLAYELGDAALAWRRTRAWPLRSLVRRGLLLGGPFLLVWLGGLWLLDTRVGTFATPWEHIGFMTQYGLELARAQGPANSESLPWQWLVNQVQIPYLKVETEVLVNGQLTETRPTVEFLGAMNPILMGAFPLAFGVAIWQLWKVEDRLSLWIAAWLTGTYLPFYPLALMAHRISYIFYFLPVLPAVALAVALLLRRSQLPGIAVWTYLGIVAAGFVAYFPFHQPP
jgi:dolichyl-phosphate-mannose-protein mannosyltransferase